MSAVGWAADTIAIIRQYPDGCLRKTATAMEPGSPEAQSLLDRLWSTLDADGGVGLAAPQIGVSRRVVVIRDPSRPVGQQRVDLVNPVIEKSLGPQKPFEEGCLSFPGLFVEVLRPQGVQVSFFDYEGQERTIRDSKLLARIIQHEMDHLDGILFVDHLSRWQKVTFAPRLGLIALGHLFKRGS